jgi:hypothetical protein
MLGGLIPLIQPGKKYSNNSVCGLNLSLLRQEIRDNFFKEKIFRRDFRWARVKQDRVDWPTNSEGDFKTLARTEQIPELADLFAKMSTNFENDDLEEVVEPYRVSKEDIEFQDRF